VPPLLTVGHGRLDRLALAALLRKTGVSLVVDVRRFPASRAHPQVRREALDGWLPEEGIAYRWEERLGGRRSRIDGDADEWWQVRAFRAYAAYLREEAPRAALADVLDDAAARTTAVMCSESVWWRCHRRLIADVAVLSGGAAVLHLGHDGRLTPHAPAVGAVLGPDRLVRYPAPGGAGPA
jgi:uncharacterized protein (DUF488 family)